RSTDAARSSSRLGFQAVIAVVCAGLIWGLYNIAFVMIFSFGPSMLVERGWSIPAAGSIISIVLWLSAVSVPLGGLLADRSGRHRCWDVRFGCRSPSALSLHPLDFSPPQRRMYGRAAAALIAGSASARVQGQLGKSSRKVVSWHLRYAEAVTMSVCGGTPELR